MVAIAIARMIVCAMGIISRPTDDHTHASRRALESFKENFAVLCKDGIAEWKESATPLLLHVGRVVEGVVTCGATCLIGHGLRCRRRTNARPAPAHALHGGDVGPFVQADQFHFHAHLSLTSAGPRRGCMAMAWPNILGAPAGRRRMGT